MNDPKAYERIENRVDEKMSFYVHLAVYILVNGLLITLNLITAPGTFWSMWPLFGWGIGLAFHGMNVFVLGRGAAMRERMIDAELKKERMTKAGFET